MTGLIVHEWIEKMGGAERVLDQMVQQFPDSEIACLWDDAPDRYPSNRVHQSWMAKTRLRDAKAAALPMMSRTWRSWRADQEYEWLLASSYVFAHHARFRAGSHSPTKFVYVHTPARYIWAPELDPRGSSPVVRAAAPFLRRADKLAARDESALAANSAFVRDRIARSWSRDSTVIYPPVGVSQIGSVANWGDHLVPEEEAILSRLPETFLLGASRFVAYKELDTVIRTAETAGLPVVIAGQGPMAARLQALAASAVVPVTILHAPSDNLLYALYQRAMAYVFPPIEDFGIMPVEAMAAGCPVLVNATGGTSESVLHGVSGFHLARFDGEDVQLAIARLESLDRTEIRNSAMRFDASRFRSELADWIGSGVGHPVIEASDDEGHAKLAGMGGSAHTPDVRV